MYFIRLDVSYIIYVNSIYFLLVSISRKQEKKKCYDKEFCSGRYVLKTCPVCLTTWKNLQINELFQDDITSYHCLCCLSKFKFLHSSGGVVDLITDSDVTL